jgi:hypothetical protein
MRFLICARHRATGAASVVSDRTYPTRDAAVAAVASRSSLEGLAGSDLFLIDLEAATPVMIVAGGVEFPEQRSGKLDDPGIPRDSVALEEWPFVDSDEGGVGPSTLGEDRLLENADSAEMWWLETGAGPDDAAPVELVVTEGETEPASDADDGSEGDPSPIEERAAHVQLRVDLEAWTCADCIFPGTCPKVGTDRPATCGSFQWKAE